MSSINLHYTFNYSQPEEYHFSHDSVFLARRVFELLGAADLSAARALDICSGSGIVGLDFLFHRREAGLSVPADFDFLEIQEAYRSHFQENVNRLGEIQTQCHFVRKNYDDLQLPEYAGKFDLVLCNPPYFLQSQGKLSPSEFKNRCRFFIDSDLKNLLLGIGNCMTAQGAAYMLLRDLPEHRWNVLEEAKKILAGKLQVEILGEIRGTHFVRLLPI